jgi:DNA-binding GntR family transcriptional regulator
MPKPIPLLKPTSTADRVANILRERILGMVDGDYLGSEAGIANEFGVSLPTLRQAARLLEYEQLLLIKPGKGGGYFTRRPAIETAIKSASQYLSSQDLLSDAMWMDCAEPLVSSLLMSIVKCEEEALFEELQQFIVAQREIIKCKALPDDSFQYSVELMTLFGKMSDNVLLELFVRILWNEVSISNPNSASFEESQKLLRKNYKTRLAMAEAIYAKDLNTALKVWEQRAELLRNWPQKGFSVGADSTTD